MFLLPWTFFFYELHVCVRCYFPTVGGGDNFTISLYEVFIGTTKPLSTTHMASIFLFCHFFVVFSYFIYDVSTGEHNFSLCFLMNEFFFFCCLCLWCQSWDSFTKFNIMKAVLCFLLWVLYFWLSHWNLWSISYSFLCIVWVKGLPLVGGYPGVPTLLGESFPQVILAYLLKISQPQTQAFVYRLSFCSINLQVYLCAGTTLSSFLLLGSKS